nr:AjuE [Cystobacter sp.]
MSSNLDIAIIGMAGRFPGAKDLDQFWRNLRDGVESIRSFTDEELAASGVSPALRSNPRYVRAAPVLEDVDRFDAGFFGFNPREAEQLDPQHRLFLECTWEALERAGYDPRRFPGSIGLYAGASISTYLLGNLAGERDLTMSVENLQTLLGNDKDYLATQVAYKLDLRGPVLTVQTACSTSLVAVHLACQALLDGECELALAGGVTVRLPHHAGYVYQEGGLFSPDGHCRPFDADAKGTVFGSGAGVVVLKKLENALADGDRIHAVIKGSAINNDGSRKAGFTAPGIEGQVEVISAALGVAQVAPETIGYIEAHGTGTPLGDPIEVDALSEVFGNATKAKHFCALGAVKASIGHLEAAAGIAGLIKTVLALEHRQLPPSLNFAKPNPQIDFDNSPFFVNTRLAEWKRGTTPRRAGVSSFGIGGTNAHVVLEEAPERKEPVREQVAQEVVLPLSARNEEALKALAGEYVKGLEEQGAPGVEEAGYTAAVRRAHHEQRLAVVGASREEWTEKLRAWLRGEERPGLAAGKVEEGRRGKVVFVFPGQGSQWEGMGRELMGKEPVFRQAIEACDAALKRHVKWSLKEVLEKGQGLEKVEVIQPALFAVEVALAALWRSWGVEPDAVVGHSMGEVAAAHVAGALSLEDAARVICERSRLVASTSGKGGMAVVELGAEEAEKRIAGKGGRVSVAASNGPRSTVLAGEKEAVGEVLKELEGEGKFCRWVKVDYASHSAQMEALKPELMRVLGSVRPKAGNVPIYSTVSMKAGNGADFDASYWVRNLRERVRFAEVVKKLKEEGHGLFVEMSPHPILKNEVEGSAGGGVVALPSLRRGEPEKAAMLGSLGALYAAGHEVDWTKQHPQGGRFVALPTYPWQRQRYWIEPSAEQPRRTARPASGSHPLLQHRLELATDARSSIWEGELDVRALPYLDDHKVDGTVVVPGTAYLEMGLAAAAEVLGAEGLVLEKVEFKKALALPEGSVRLQVSVSRDADDVASFSVHSRGQADGSPWILHAEGSLRRGRSAEVVELIDSIVTRCAEVPVGAHYEALRARGLEYGPSFQGITRLWRREGEALARVQLSATLAPEASSYRAHPALLDAGLQVLAAAAPRGDSGQSSDTFLPVGIERLRLHSSPSGPLYSHATLRASHVADELEGDILLLDEQGRAVIEILGLRARRLETGSQGDDVDSWFYSLAWRPVSRPAAGVTEPRGAWLLLADSHGLAERLAPMLGARAVFVQAVPGLASGHERIGPDRYRLDPARKESFRQLFTEVFGNEAPAGVVDLWALGAELPEDAGPEVLPAAESVGTVGALHLVQAVLQAGWRDAPRVWLVTRGAQAVLESERAPLSPVQALLWGLARSVAHEHPELCCTAVDLAPVPDARDAVILAEELRSADKEDQIALRGEARYAARLVRGSARVSSTSSEAWRPAGDRPYRLEVANPGVLDSLVLREVPRREPGPGEVEIRVRAASLNFLDVLSALGALPGAAPGESPRLGGECAGVVAAVGEGVSELKPGDEVVAIASHCFGTHVTTLAAFAVRKPAHLSFEEAAGLPVAFMTAHYALHRLGHVEPGERVLIHSASGGTGLAAVRIAQRAGAEVFATAGSEEKRAYLRSLGIRHVMDSRSLAFAEEIQGLTGGAGVDVVLNSLAGAAIQKGLESLAPYGRFLEIGKRPIYENSRVGLLPFRRNLAYHAIDLSRMAMDRPERFAGLLREVMERFERRELEPLPVTCLPITEAAEAFRRMAQAKHIGKLVLSLDVPDVRIAPPAEAVRIRPDASYLITGGLGGVGSVLARALVARGAKHLALLGRGGATTPAAREAVASMEAAGARVLVLRADVADAAQLGEALARIRAELPPLRGILHGAVVLDDGVVLQQTPERFRTALAPKVDGAWNLHRLTRNEPLDFFVMLSSVVSVLGSPGQANYAAANSFLDTLVSERRARGLPGQSINWGPWAEVGLAAAQENRGARAASHGMSSIPPEAGAEAFLRTLLGGTPRPVVMPFHLRRWIQSFPRAAASPLLAELVAEQGASAGAQAGAFRAALLAAEPPARLSLLESHLREQIARVLRLDPSRIDRQTPFNTLGLDSLMALALRNRLEESLGLTLSATVLWGYPTIAALAPHLAARMQVPLAPAAEAVPQEQKDRGALDEAMREVSTLSEDDALQALLAGQG